MTLKTYEYEERAFLSEDDFFRIKTKLDNIAVKTIPDNKISYFFVLADKNVSITTSPIKTVVKYKGGQLGNGDNGFEEHEFAIKLDELSESIDLFTSLLNLKPLKSEQFRINYILPNSIEVALKYTLTWGFHIEVEKLYSANDSEKNEVGKTQARNEVDNVGSMLGIKYTTDEEMKQFVDDIKVEKSKGSYSPDEFRQKYGQLF